MKRRHFCASYLLVLSLATLARATAIVYPVNNGFEDPNVGSGFGYGIANVDNLGVSGLPSTPSGWTFAGTTGIAANGSGFGVTGATNGNSDGATSTKGQAAFLQNGFGSPNSISQNVKLPEQTAYVTFSLELRGSQDVSVNVSLDGFDLGTYKPLSGSSFNTVMTPSVTLPTGTYPLVFTGVDSPLGGDNTVFIDNIIVNTIPEPSAILSLTVGVAGLLLVFAGRLRARRGCARNRTMQRGLARTTVLIATIAIVALLCTSSLTANVIDPISATATDNYGSRTPDHTFDGSGLSGSGLWQQHTSGGAGNTGLVDASMYLSLDHDLTPTITWNLGAVYNLEGLHVWNYNEGYNGGSPGDFTSRGIHVADVQVSNDSTFSTFTDLGQMTFGKATGLDTYTGETHLFAPVDAQYVRFLTASNYGDSTYTGLSEIRFIATPEPSSIVLCVLGALALLLAARRRRQA